MSTVTIKLAGTNYIQASPFPEIFPSGLPLVLVREPRNPVDEHAIGVWVTRSIMVEHSLKMPQDGAARWKLGMIPASGKHDWAEALAPLLDTGKSDIKASFARHDMGTECYIWLSGEDVAKAEPKGNLL